MVEHEIETLVDRLCLRPFSDLCTTNNVLEVLKKNKKKISKHKIQNSKS